MDGFNDEDWTVPPSEGPLFPIVVPHEAPVHWKNEIVNNQSWYKDRYMKVNYNRALQDDLTCSYCLHSLSVKPIFYEAETLYSVCGRCSRRSDSIVHEKKMLRDHLYEKLLPHLVFECSYDRCDKTLLSLQVEDHERSCSYKWQFQDGRHELYDSHSGDETYFVTLPDVRSLRDFLSCETCAKPLSVFPVISNGTVFICGRCSVPKASDWTPQMVYESMAAYMKFPCAHQGCTELLKMADVEEHEKICRWANMQCPLLCDQNPKILEMSLHVRSNNHLHEAVSNRLDVKEQTSVFKIESEPYIVSIEAVVDEHGQEQHLSCAAYGLDDKEYGNLCLEIVDADNDSVLEAHQIKVATLTTQELGSTDRVVINSHYRKSSVFLRLLDAESVDGVALDDESREALECNVCFSYMTRLIFMCENKHPICDRCKVQVKSCPMCRGVLANDRHLELESEAAKFKFPCAFRESNDCQVALIPKFLAKHEVRCGGGAHDDGQLSAHCWFDRCAVSFRSYQFEDYFNHCAEHHRGLVMFQGSEQTLEWSSKDWWLSGKRVLFFDGQSFYIEYDYGDDTDFIFKVTQLVANSKVYKYTLEFLVDGLIVERRGKCCVPSMGTLVKDLQVNASDINVILKKAVNAFKSVSLLTYRIRFEEDLN